MSIKICIQLPKENIDALLLLSMREFRDPKQQAAYLIQKGLEAAGVLAKPTTNGQQQTVLLCGECLRELLDNTGETDEKTGHYKLYISPCPHCSAAKTTQTQE